MLYCVKREGKVDTEFKVVPFMTFVDIVGRGIVGPATTLNFHDLFLRQHFADASRIMIRDLSFMAV